jgi:hypothetical protein
MRLSRRSARDEQRCLQRHVIDVKADFNARGDTRVVTDASIAIQRSTLCSDSAGFSSADVGKSVIVQGAGASTITGSYDGSSDQITGVANIAGYGNGSLITGPGLSPGTKIIGGAGTNTLTISHRTTEPGVDQTLTVQSALHGTITSVNGDIATLSNTASFPVDAATASYGADDTAALTAAIVAGAAQRRAVYIPAGNYLCLRSICNVSQSKAGEMLPTIYGDGIGITVLTAYLFGPPTDVTALFNVEGAIEPRIAAPELGGAGSRVLTLPDTSALMPEQTLYLIDQGQPFLSGGGYTPIGYAGEVVRICQILSSTQVLIYGGLEYDYGDQAHYQVPSHLEGFTLRDLTICNPAPTTQSVAARGITLRLVKDVRIENLRFERMDASAMRFAHVINFRVQACEFHDLQNVRTGNNPYGICCAQWCTSGVVVDCISDSGCHLFTTGCNPKASPPSHIVVANCIATNHTKAAFDTHPGSRFITFIGDQVHGCAAPAFQIRGQDCQVIEPIVSGLAPALSDMTDGRSGVGVYFVFGAERGRLQGGRISSVPYGVIVRSSSDVSIVGTHLQNVLRCGVCVQVDGPYPNPTNLVIEDIDIAGSSTATGVDFEVWDNTYRLSRVRCSGLARNISGAQPTTISAAATLTPTLASDTWAVTGDTSIESIGADMSHFGRRITLKFSGACAVNPNGTGNVKLLQPFAGSQNGTLTLVCDGKDWLEVARSPSRPVLGERSVLIPAGYHTEGPLARTLVGSAGPPITSGTPLVVAFEVPGGAVITKGAFLFAAPDSDRTHLWYALTDADGNTLLTTEDDRDLIVGGALHPLSFTVPYVMPADGVLYLCLVHVAGALARLAGAAVWPSSVQPILVGDSTTTGQLGPADAPPKFGLPDISGAHVPYAVLG